MEIRITPSNITSLKPNEIFVFGSNLQGNHAGGAAKFAVMKFGAIMGNGDGLQGNSYAIPTLSEAAIGVDLNDIKLPLNKIGGYVDKFLHFANENQDKIFYVTPIGCGIAGFNEREIAPLFSKAVNMKNVYLPKTFWDILGTNDNVTKIGINDITDMVMEVISRLK